MNYEYPHNVPIKGQMTFWVNDPLRVKMTLKKNEVTVYVLFGKEILIVLSGKGS